MRKTLFTRGQGSPSIKGLRVIPINKKRYVVLMKYSHIEIYVKVFVK